MKDFLAFFGLLTICMIFILILVLIWEAVSELIRRAIWRYKYTHRFDRKPMAKCYCKDCVNYNSYDNRCCYHNYYISDAYFCSDAKPRKKEVKE